MFKITLFARGSLVLKLAMTVMLSGYVCSPALAQDADPAASESVLATLFSRKGTVEGRFTPEGGWEDAEKGTEFSLRQAIKVGDNGRAGVKFADGMLVRLGAKAFLEFAPQGQRSAEINMKNGKGYFFNRKQGRRPSIKTPVVSAAIRGTEFSIEVDEDNTTINVIEGQVLASNEFGEVVANGGERIKAKRGSAPVKEILVDIQDQIQWALFYPPVVDSAALLEGGLSASEAEMMMASRNASQVGKECLQAKLSPRKEQVCALAAIDVGDVDTALALLSRGDSSFNQITKSGVLLSIGQAEEAEQLLASYRESDNPEIQAAALAQQAVIELTKGDLASARTAALAALEASPTSAAAALSRSYIAQADSDVDTAHATLQRAVQDSPDNALLWARFAELELALNDVRGAEDAIKRSRAINDKEIYASMVDGYVQLLLGERDEAEQLFSEVIEREPELSYAQLGMGLAQVGRGDLDAGGDYIQKAVHLSPGAASYRSYLGKVFFEQDDYTRARDEYDVATSLDDEDPTPFLYRAFLKLAENNPVGALKDVQESIQRNDNRAVFRSKVLLDQDNAVRSASLARVYNDLGFFEAGRIEAIKAISKDYLNYSAHRLLAGAYGREGLTVNAFTTENTLSNLLAPPSLNLFFGNGERNAGGDFTALFDSNEQRTQLSGIASTVEDQLLGRVLTAGRVDDIGYALDGFQENLNGSKSGAFRTRSSVTGTVKYEPTFGHQLTLTGTYQDDRFGGDFNPDSPLETDNAGTQYNARLEYRGDIAPNLTILSRAGYFHENSENEGLVESGSTVVSVFDEFVDPETGEDFKEIRFSSLRFSDRQARTDTGVGQLQFVYSPEFVTTVGGYSYQRDHSLQDSRVQLIDTTDEFVPFGAGTIPDTFLFGNDLRTQTVSSQDTTVHRAYLYSTFHLTDWLDWTLAGSYVELERQASLAAPFIPQTVRQSGFNPKTGVVITPADWVSVRGAYFRERYDSRADNIPRLEPVLVGGINQLNSGTLFAEVAPAETFAFGLDFKLNKTSYFGAEYQRIDVEEPSFDVLELIEADFTGSSPVLFTGTQGQIGGTEPFVRGERQRDIDLLNTYFYQVLTSRLVGRVSGGYFRSRGTLTVDDDLSLETQDIGGTQKGYLGNAALEYFHPDLWFAGFNGTYRNFEFAGSNDLAFWQWDAKVGYRFPNRRGRLELRVVNIFDESDAEIVPLVPLDKNIPFEQGVQLVASFNF